MFECNVYGEGAWPVVSVILREGAGGGILGLISIDSSFVRNGVCSDSDGNDNDDDVNVG